MRNNVIPKAEQGTLFDHGQWHGAPAEIWQYLPNEILIDGTGTGLVLYSRVSNDRRVIEPVGYCKTGCPGHSDPDDAREHFRQYQLDECLVYSMDDDTNTRLMPCSICGALTSASGVVGLPDTGDYCWTRSFPLCLQHKTRESVEKLYHFDDMVLVEFYPEWTES
jgi:hypothetical protein